MTTARSRVAEAEPNPPLHDRIDESIFEDIRGLGIRTWSGIDLDSVNGAQIFTKGASLCNVCREIRGCCHGGCDQ